MIRLGAIAAILCLMLGAAPPVTSTGTQPVKVTADNFAIDEATHEAVFTGNVLVIHPRVTVWAAKVVSEYGAGGPSDVKTFIATGNVKLKTKDQTATGDKAVFDPKTQLLHLTGNVLVVNASGKVNSPELVVDLEKNTSVFTSSKGSRVTSVFNPQ
ncbi:MAG TPA: LptA/OstA family protein [Arsenicitalea sp.]|jgi:lipopolysaccharide export system protein LptA|nr:LptA/OstA family protein [Arsenicitalea sp.]